VADRVSFPVRPDLDLDPGELRDRLLGLELVRPCHRGNLLVKPELLPLA